MSHRSTHDEPPTKRQKLSTLSHSSSLNRAISPPPLRRESATTASPSKLETKLPPAGKAEQVDQVPLASSMRIDAGDSDYEDEDEDEAAGGESSQSDIGSTLVIASPFKLTRIKDLPAVKNIDTVTLKDVIGDPIIRELWSFNYMHKIPFIVLFFGFSKNMDEDTRQACVIKIVHGYWKNYDESRLQMESDVKSLANYNIELVSAYLPDTFGTHHTKMLVLLRYDDTVEIIVHTANMIRFDWENMTQAVWRSPRLPLLVDDTVEQRSGVGYDFKQSFLSYLDAYGKKRCGTLVEQLRMYNFVAVRALFVGHVPGKHAVSGDTRKLFGWVKMKDLVAKIPVAAGLGTSKMGTAIVARSKGFLKGSGELVAQVSSIATLGAKETYLTDTIFSALCPSPAARYNVVWPTVEDVRTSCNGWQSGTAIHIKDANTANEKQLAWLRPYMTRWGGRNATATSSAKILEAGRAKAAPHIKTFTRFSPRPENATTHQYHQPPVDWSLFTSANLSKQAWGSEAKAGEVHVQSYEAGILIWPGLWADLLADDDDSSFPTRHSQVEMQGVGSKDWLECDEDADRVESADAVLAGKKYRKVVVGVRLPYDYPLTPYSNQDQPWVVGKDYGELRDWTGSQWPPR